MYDVRDHGAAGDGRETDTEAIQSAIDACEDGGGGTVYLPPGRYLSGTLSIRTDVTLHLDGGAILLQSRDPSDYPEGRMLIRGDGAERIAITGRGTIDGQTTDDLGRRPGREGEERPAFRTRLVLLDNCENLRIRDVTMRNSDSWTLHLRRCRDAVVDGVTILNNYYRTNTDGINPDSCRNVRISNCHIVAGDDCICLKARDGDPCENVVVSNCTTESIATAIKLGTESSGDFRDVLVTNCTIRNSTIGLGIYVKDGATVERVTFSNISIGTVEEPALVNAPRLRNAIYPVFFDLEKRSPSSSIGRIRDITLRDIQIASDNGVLIQGMPESPIENLAVHNLSMRVNRWFDYSERKKHAGGRANPDDDRITLYARKPSYLTMAHVEGFTVDHLRLTVADEVLSRGVRSALAAFRCRDGLVGDVTRSPTIAGPEVQPAVRLEDCQEVRREKG